MEQGGSLRPVLGLALLAGGAWLGLEVMLGNFPPKGWTPTSTVTSPAQFIDKVIQPTGGPTQGGGGGGGGGGTKQ